METNTFAFRKEGEAAFDIKPEAPADSQPAEKETENVPEVVDTPVEKVIEKDVPFHEHPRWKEREENWNKRLAEIERKAQERIAEVEGKLPKAESVKSETKLPSWWGGDEEQYKAFQEDQRQLLVAEKAKEASERENQEKQQAQLVKEATEEFNSTISKLETESGDKIDPNKFLKFVMDEQFINFQTKKWDYERAWKFYQLQQKPSDSTNIEERKRLASLTTKEKSGGGGEKKNFKTADDFKGSRPW
jgi:hypothetical protein